MLIAIVVVCPLIILGILFYPRRPRFVRRVTRNMNGQPRWRDQELY
ncbi:MAG: hypothetical protein IT327_27640 [Anaerolineae bacterium]|nr:hypothetical protein [Anaerolineae bacterium]